MGRLKIVATCLLGLAIIAAPAFGQERRPRSNKSGFSQLTFDTAPKGKGGRETVSFEEMMNDPSLIKDSKNSAIIVDRGGAAKPVNAGAATPAAEGVNTESPPTNLLDVTGYLVPNLKGPSSDKSSPSSITSKERWLEKKGSFCAQALNTTELCAKARAMREVVQRFSGNADFYESQCSEECGSPHDVSRLVGFKVMDVTKGVIRYEGDGEHCFFSLKKAAQAKWVMIPVYDPECACLPRNCM